MVLRVCTLHHSKWKQLVSIISFWLLITYLIPCSAFTLTTLHSQDWQWWQIPPFLVLFFVHFVLRFDKGFPEDSVIDNIFGSLFGFWFFFSICLNQSESRPPKLKSWVVHGHNQFRWRGLILKPKPDTTSAWVAEDKVCNMHSLKLIRELHISVITQPQKSLLIHFDSCLFLYCPT